MSIGPSAFSPRYSQVLPRNSCTDSPKADKQFDTGKDLDDAQFKVVILACEVERLSAMNYQLVQEAENVKKNLDKTQREKEMEMKVTVLLTENERLNRAIEMLSADYGKQAQQLKTEVNRWHQLYTELQAQSQVQSFQQQFKKVSNERDSLKAENKILYRQNVNLAQSMNETMAVKSCLKVESESLRRTSEEETLKLKNETSKVYAEIDSLNVLIQQIKTKNNREINELMNTVKILSQEHEQLKELNQQLMTERNELADENEDLVQNQEQLMKELSRLMKSKEGIQKDSEGAFKAYQEGVNDFVEKINLLSQENTELRERLGEMEDSDMVEDLKRQIVELTEERDELKKGVEELAETDDLIEEVKIRALTDENEALTRSLNNKIRENEQLNQRVREAEHSKNLVDIMP
jgi:chromosome segregation ATPase